MRVFLSEDQRARPWFITAKGTGITDGLLTGQTPRLQGKPFPFHLFRKNAHPK